MGQGYQAIGRERRQLIHELIFPKRGGFPAA
jgi:hypothetical protein